MQTFSEFLATDLAECVIARLNAGGHVVLAKNRDRMYKPTLKVVHTVVEGVEMVYMMDTVTDWSEGMNAHGIGLVNTALMVGYDEKEKKIVKTTGRPSKDGAKIRKVLSAKTLDEAVRLASSYMGGIRGHTIVASPEGTVSIEATSKHKIATHRHPKDSLVVRTNHGHAHPTAGYTKGKDYLSSKIRKETAEKSLKGVNAASDVLAAMAAPHGRRTSNLNPLRATSKMFTSSQCMMDLTEKQFTLRLVDGQVENFEGVTTTLPKGHRPALRINVIKS